MYWNSLSDFLAMGGKGFYVWGSVIAVFLGLIIEIIILKTSRKKTLTAIKNHHH